MTGSFAGRGGGCWQGCGKYGQYQVKGGQLRVCSVACKLVVVPVRPGLPPGWEVCGRVRVSYADKPGGLLRRSPGSGHVGLGQMDRQLMAVLYMVF